VRDRVVGFLSRWQGSIRESLEAAVERGEVADRDVDQLLYDVTAFIALAHSKLVLDGTDNGLVAAARAVRLRLDRA
jgi:hypothetical protein